MEDRGFEPLTATPQAAERKALAPPVPEALARTLAHETPIDPDLARVMAAWSTLAEPIRRAILALIAT